VLRFFCFHSILDCIVFLLDVIFGKVQFTVVILPDFLLELTWQILLVILQNHVCQQSTIQSLLEDRWRVGSSESQNHEKILHLPNGTWFVQILWWLL
jgi:hypothetical protein